MNVENQIPIIPYPVYNIFLNINNGCNLRCQYCWYNATNQPEPFEEMTQANFLQALKIIYNSIQVWKNNKHFFSYPKFRVAIATKEPLLSFYSLIKPVLDEFSWQDCFDIYLLTNGTLLTQEIVDWCINKGITIQVSIDGCEQSHNTNRQKHQTILNNLKLIPDLSKNLFIVSTFDKNTIPYIKQNLEFFKEYFPNTPIKFNFNIFKQWTLEDWDCVFKQFSEFIQENDTKNLKFLDIYRETPMFIDEGRGYIVGIDRHGNFSIKKPFHSSIPRIDENEWLSQFNFGNIYNINYTDWIKYYQTMGRDFSLTKFENIHNKCKECSEYKFCFNCDYNNKKIVYKLTDDECYLKSFRRKIENILKQKEQGK